jgi:hypothetical protein
LRELLLGARLPFAVIGGRGEARTAGALAALTALPALAPALTPAIGPALAAATPTAPRAGLFTRLGDDDAEAGLARADWRCECCIEGDAERRLRKLAAGRETPVR